MPPAASLALPLPSPSASPWQVLQPLAHAPVGALCCTDADGALLLVRLTEARAALAEALWRKHRGPHGHWPHASVLLPPSLSFDGAAAPRAEAMVRWLDSAAGDYVGLVLEPIGPHRYAVCRQPTLWPGTTATAVAQAIFACWSEAAPAPTALDAPAPLLRAVTAALVARGSFAEHTGGAVSQWAPALLGALAELQVPLQARLCRRIASADD